MSFFPILELIDRLAIAEIKFERTQANQEELDWYRHACADIDLHQIDELYSRLVFIHNTIWDLESQLKSGKENELSLEEIGRRAIEIRDWNRKRIAIKNQIADVFNSPVKEIKSNHLSI